MLQSIGTSFRVADLSPELQERFKDGYVRQVIVNCTDMTDMIPNAVKYQYHGFMHKDDVFRFETEYEVWGYDYITKAEYLALPNELKAFYQYYEWDDPDDWFYHFKQIINNVQAQVDFFCGINNLCSESCEKRIVMFEV